jgi:type VI secretion system protein VasJ
LPVQVPEAAAAAPAAPAQPASAPAAGAPAARPAGEIKTPDDANNNLNAGLDLLAQVSDFWMQQDPSNPLPYRLTRITAWLTVDGLPVADGGKTMIPPPDTMIRSSIDNLMANRSYLDAAVAAESRVTQFLFWLDLSRITAQALEGLGGKYQEASDAVSLDTALFVQRLKGIENLTVSDGTPFADHDTKGWLKANAPGGGQDAPLSAGGGDAIETEVAEIFGQAKGLIKDKKVYDAIGLLEDNLSRGGSGKARLLWRIALSQLLADAGQQALALPHLDEILAEIDAFKLESWDPKLALSGLRAVYAGLADETGDKAEEKAKMALDRIARISPAQALHLIKT